MIKESGLNQDGHEHLAGLTIPNAETQADLIEQTWKDAGIDPETILFIETHGTGIPLEDPIEIDGMTKAVRKYTQKKNFCAVGTIKTNFGHLDNAARIPGFFKTVLCLKNKKFPSLVHFKTPNSKIDFKSSPVFPADQTIDLSNGDNPIRCGVSSFGISGINCHVVLGHPPDVATKRAPIENPIEPKKKYWIKLPDMALVHVEPVHDDLMDSVFIKELQEEIPGSNIYSLVFLKGCKWLLDEHRIKGDLIFLGFAYFQLISEAAKNTDLNNSRK